MRLRRAMLPPVPTRPRLVRLLRLRTPGPTTPGVTTRTPIQKATPTTIPTATPTHMPPTMTTIRFTTTGTTHIPIPFTCSPINPAFSSGSPAEVIGSVDTVGSTEVAGPGDSGGTLSAVSDLARPGGSAASEGVVEGPSSFALEGRGVQPSAAAASALALRRAPSVIADSDLQASHVAVSPTDSGDLGEAPVSQVALPPAAASEAVRAWPVDRPEDAEGARARRPRASRSFGESSARRRETSLPGLDIRSC